MSRKSPKLTGGTGRAVRLDADEGVGDDDRGGGVAVSSETRLRVDSLAMLSSLRGRTETEDTGDETVDSDTSLDHEGELGRIG